VKGTYTIYKKKGKITTQHIPQQIERRRLSTENQFLNKLSSN